MDESCKRNRGSPSKRNRLENPWITTALINSISKRDRLYRKWKQTKSKLCTSGDPRLFEEYRKDRNSLSNLIKKSKQNFYTKKFENATGNLKQTWALINQLRGKCKSSIISHLTMNKCTVLDDKVIANKFNSYFCSLADNLNKNTDNSHASDFSAYLPKSETSPIFFEDISNEEIMSIVKDFNNDKSSDILIVVIKRCAPVIASTLCRLYNECIKTGKFPQMWQNYTNS